MSESKVPVKNENLFSNFLYKNGWADLIKVILSLLGLWQSGHSNGLLAGMWPSNALKYKTSHRVWYNGTMVQPYTCEFTQFV